MPFPAPGPLVENRTTPLSPAASGIAYPLCRPPTGNRWRFWAPETAKVHTPHCSFGRFGTQLPWRVAIRGSQARSLASSPEEVVHHHKGKCRTANKAPNSCLKPWAGRLSPLECRRKDPHEPGHLGHPPDSRVPLTSPPAIASEPPTPPNPNSCRKSTRQEACFLGTPLQRLRWAPIPWPAYGFSVFPHRASSPTASDPRRRHPDGRLHDVSRETKRLPLLRDRIVAVAPARPAPPQALRRQPGSSQDAVAPQGFLPVPRAARLEPAVSHE